MNVIVEDMLSGFGFQVELDHLNLANLWYSLHQTPTRFYVFDKNRLPRADKEYLIEHFIELTNSDALCYISDDQPDEEPNHLILATDRPFMDRQELSAYQVMEKLKETTGCDFQYEFSHFESGSWKDACTMVILLPVDVKFGKGQTNYEYDQFDFNILKHKLNFRGDGPERLSFIDGHYIPSVNLASTTLDFKFEKK